MAYLQSKVKLVGSLDVEALKQRFGEKIKALEEDKRLLQLERGSLLDQIAHLESLSEPTIKEKAMNADNLEAIEAGDCDPHYHAALELFLTNC